jgi:hypothetical protein
MKTRLAQSIAPMRTGEKRSGAVIVVSPEEGVEAANDSSAGARAPSTVFRGV